MRALSPDEAHEARPVHLRGVVTLHSAVSQRLVLQDGTGGLSVDLTSLGTPSSYQGQLVELDGLTGRGDRVPVVINPRIRTVGPGTLPEPRLIAPLDLVSGDQDDQWVAVRGVVRSPFVQHDGALALHVVADGHPFTAVVDRSNGILFSSLVDSTVRLLGVASSTVGARREVIEGRLLVPGRDQIEVEEPVAANPYAVAARSISSLSGEWTGSAIAHRVRIRGTVSSEDPGEGILVRDGTGQTQVRLAHSIPLGPGNEVDVLGFIVPGSPVSLAQASVRRVSSGVSGGGSPRDSQPLSTARSVQSLTAEDAAQGRDVRLNAVVTYYDPDWSMLFVQDATGGIFIDANGQGTLDLHAGDRVLVEGITDPGEFAPEIVNPHIRRLGPGALPPDRPVSAEQLLTGRLDSQWVEAEGIVQSTTQHDGRLRIDVTAGLYRFSVSSPAHADPATLRGLVDARVKVRGACGTLFNERKQLVGAQLYVTDLSYVSVVTRGTADPFSLPTRSVASLLQYDPDGAAGHRVRVQGVTTLRRPEGVFLQDQTGGLLVQTDDATPLRPGDRVEAVGFPTPGEYMPVLRDAVIRKLNAGPPPVAPLISAAEAATGNHDAALIRLEAYLLERTSSSHEQVLTLQAGKTVFNAVVPRDADTDRLSSLKPGSLLELTGLCAVQADMSRAAPVARSFRLLLRSAADVSVVENAPWWTARHTVWGASAMAAIILAVLAWVILLRRQVREQTHTIQRRQRELLTAEKMASLGRLTAGIAHEMNTPLATVRAALFELHKLNDEYGASIADESVTADDHREINAEMQRSVALADKAAENAAGFVRGIKSQTRDMEQQEDRQFQAAPVIEEALMLLGHAARNASCTLEFERTADLIELRGLPGRLAQVVTNLVTNALDASAARGGRVQLELARNGAAVHLKVGDQGTGIPPEILPRIFDPMFTSKPFGEGTGLGLSIVHDIVTGHFGGEIKVLSEVGRGTTFEVVFPKRIPLAAPVAVAS